MSKINVFALLLVLQSGATNVIAADYGPIKKRMAELFPDDNVTSIEPTPVAGIVEVMIGASVFYLSADGRYVIRGDLIDLADKVNLSNERRVAARKTVFENLDTSQVIEFPAANGKARETLYVYTDIDCGYCRKMHLEVPELNKAGIAVRYLAFPRAGLKGESFDKATAVWCSADRQQALTAAKAGETVSAPACASPVAEHFELGQAMGVSGTPAVYTAGGQQLGGYIPAARLIEEFR